MSFLEVPQTQSTAPVFEYRCLFTSDLRRKQKRWQDGQLKFHTFNNRVMVYDDRANFIGDTHWREDELNEGEELELERRGIMVEVGECTGQKNQDISEIVDKPRKEKEDRAAARAAASPVSRNFGTPSGSEFSRPKPLNQVLTPSGHYGRAVISNVSPFDEKHKQDRQPDTSERPSKRRKADDTSSKSGYAHNLMGASLNLSSSMPSNTAMRHGTLKLKTAPMRIQQATIDLTSDSDGDASAIVRPEGTKQVMYPPSQPTSKAPKRNKRSPVAKSGYANNLTGAALSFAQPAQVASRCTSNLGAKKRSPSPMAIGDPASSISESLFMIDSPISKCRPTLSNFKMSTNEAVKPATLKDIFESRSSSPALDENLPRQSPKRIVCSVPQEKPKQILKSKNSVSSRSSSPPPMPTARKPSIEAGPPVVAPLRHSAVQNSSMNEPDSTRATSSLRIKSRAPRKMMMLMEKPSSNKTPTVDKAVSRSKSNPSATIVEPVLSQATLRLNSFQAQQEERLQARLNKNRTKSFPVESSDSPPDSGIGHRTIDLLLSRRPVQSASENQDENNLAEKAPEPRTKARETHLDLPNVAENGYSTKTTIHPTLKSRELEDPSGPSVPNLQQNKNPGPPAMPDSMSPFSTELFNDISNDTQFPFSNAVPRVPDLLKKPGAPGLDSASATSAFDEVHMSNGSNSPPRLRSHDPISPKKRLLKDQSNDRSDQSKSRADKGHDKTAQNKRPKHKELPQHMTSTIQGATDHFRAMLHASQQHEENANLDLASKPCLNPSEPALVEPVPAVTIKPSPSLSSAELGLLEETTTVETGDASLSEKPLDPPPVQPIVGMALRNGARPGQISAALPPRAKIINPATRGRSLHAIAVSTVDALATGFNAAMAPPAPRALSRINQPNSREDAVVGRAYTTPVLRREDSQVGPWSRESFDLFGDWKPPQNATGNSVAAAVAA